MKQDEVQSEFQRIIVDYLENLRVSQRQFAKLTGVSDATYGGYRRMENAMGVDIMDKILVAYPKLKEILATYLTGNKMENNTHGENALKNGENAPKGDPEVYRIIVEGNTEYVLIPRKAMENAEIVSKKQLDASIKNMDSIVSKLDSDSKIMQILVSKFVETVEKVLSAPNPVQPQKSKDSA